VLDREDPRSFVLQPVLGRPTSMRLHALDAWVRRPEVLADLSCIRDALYVAARVGGAKVVGDAFHVFPNGAVTGVLLLAQSHLSIHTWPEHALANVDLLSYGDVNGDDVTRALCELLDVERAAVTAVPRAIG
jgi:S-adenosylmethionine decarboxylase